MSWYWMSFAGPGNSFLGACIVEAEDASAASTKAWELGINPGGEILFMEFDPLNCPVPIVTIKDRLMDKPELQRVGLLEP